MTTAVEIRAPAEQTEGTRSQVLRWLKNIGETVAENEPLIEIETDKVTVEVASPGAGILREIVKGEQEEIAPGEVLGRIEAAGAEAEGAAAAVAGAGGEAAGRNGAAGAGGEAAGRNGAADAGGEAPGRNGAAGAGGEAPGRNGAADAGHVAAHAVGVGASDGGSGGVQSAAVSASAGEGRGTASQDGSAATRLSPAVRRLLSENALDPSAIRGTGQGGRITVEDVLAAIASGRGAGVGGAAVVGSTGQASRAPLSVAAVAPAASAAASALGTSDVAGGSHRVPHTAIRKRVAEHMVQSLLHTAPHVTTVFEADMTAVLAHRLTHRDEFARRGAPLTLTAYFLQATVDAIRAVPEANSRWTDTALEVFDSIHVGVGTALEEGGLVVPVLRDVQSRDLFQTAQGLNELVIRAREGRLVPADVRGGTFTISNHGVSGSLVATPIIINQPQSAILGIGKLEKRPVVVEEGGVDRVVIRPRCYVTLTIDHRVMDGHQANRFLQTFVARLTNWPE
jgi:2-oxoglutarate dehydrogenase E2 component (dihydrolipoamide succinyltransferase)